MTVRNDLGGNPISSPPSSCTRRTHCVETRGVSPRGAWRPRECLLNQPPGGVRSILRFFYSFRDRDHLYLGCRFDGKSLSIPPISRLYQVAECVGGGHLILLIEWDVFRGGFYEVLRDRSCYPPFSRPCLWICTNLRGFRFSRCPLSYLDLPLNEHSDAP